MTCIIKRILSINTPVKYREFHLFDNNLEITQTSQYSWSSDGICWTNWVDLDTYKQICANIEGDYYLRILIFGGVSRVIYDGVEIDCWSLCLYQNDNYTKDLCGEVGFKPYNNLDCAINFYQQTSDLICCTFGIPIYYFRVLPDKDTKDMTFKEYVLHNVSDMKYISMVLQDGQMPSSKPQMTEFDFDWENDWEVEIGKTLFAKAFGDTAFPKQRDIIYVPLMNRLYEVNSAYDEKQEGFMWRATTWKLALIKWNEKTNVDQGEFESIIDNWAVNKIEDFLPLENIEQERETGTTQINSPTYAATNLTNIFMEDAIRKSITSTEKSNIIDFNINHGAAIVAKNAYNFANSNSVVIYQRNWCGENGSLSFIIKHANVEDENEKSIFTAGPISIYAKGDQIIFNGKSVNLTAGDIYMINCTWERKTYTASMNIYKYILTVSPDVPLYFIRPEMYKFDFENPICITTPYNNDWIITKPVPIQISPNPMQMTNIKLYDEVIPDLLKESIKFITTNEHCVINDVARQIEAPAGYNIR